MDRTQLIELAHKYVSGAATSGEAAMLHRWYDEHDLNEEIVVVSELPETSESLRARMLAKLLDSIEQEQAPNAVVRPMRRSRNWYWASAAVTIGLVAGTIYFTQPRGGAEIQAPVATATRFRNDLPAGGTKAILQLADGRTIVLDNAANGTVAVEGETTISKTKDGHLAYNAAGTKSALVFNTISTPVGGEYQVTLPDGTKVWLNAMSSLRFPAAFSGKERKVELNGEAYFEVAKNAAQPFRVAIGKAGAPNYNEVEVLGTHFNVHAFSDETSVETTLLEGSIRITANRQSILMKPGEMVLVDSKGAMTLEKNADTDEAIAWHNGLFRFKEVSIEEIMNQAKRWYGIEVVYEGRIREHFVSTIPRQSTAIAFFNILEKTGRVQFSIDGNKVTVRPVR